MVAQVIGAIGQLCQCYAAIREAEAKMENMTNGLYGLTEAEAKLVESG